MDSLYSKKNVYTLCNTICTEMDKNASKPEEIDNLLTILKIICCGIPGEKSISLYFHALHPEECIASLLKMRSFQKKLRENPSESVLIAKSFLNLSHISKELGNSLFEVMNLIPSGTEVKNILIDNLLNHTSNGNFPISLIEDSLLSNSTSWELRFLKFYEEQVEDSDYISSSAQWSNFSVLSAKIFQILSSMLNKFLCVLKDKQTVCRLINLFISETIRKCKLQNVDFVSLYPYEVQSVVSLLYLNRDCLPPDDAKEIQELITFKLKQLKKTRSVHLLILLTHFDKWNDTIKI